MRILAGPNTNALRSITGYNAGSPLRMPAAGAVGALTEDIGSIASGDVQAQSAKGEGGRILGDTAKYAAMGAAAGPIGAGVGALVGLTVGLIKNKKAKEAHKEQIADNDKANKANAAQLALAANVNSQKAPATMKSPNERNMAPNKRTEPLKRTMAPLKMAPLKRELSSMQANSSYMRTPASDVKRQEIMRTVSGSSSLKRSEEGDVSYSGPQIRYGDDGEPTGVHSATKQITVFKGQPGYEKALASAQQKKNRATDAAEARAKAKTKAETEIANQKAKANAKAAKTT